MRAMKVTVVGSGTMGRGIAQVAAGAAQGGYPTVLQDISREQLDKARAAVAKSLEEGIARGKTTPGQRDLTLANLSLETDLAKAGRDADLVIEAVPESLALKAEVFGILHKACKASTVFASNTSALSITEMGATSGRPAKFIGMHFFNPVHKMKLVELIKGKDTDDATVSLAREVSARMGKETVLVKESPGFVTSRINALIGNEAFRMLEGGVATAEDIDKALKLGLNHPMGPFEMVDLVGLDVRLSILEYLHKTLGETYRPTEIHRRLVREGRLGRKAGRGVYEYPATKEAKS